MSPDSFQNLSACRSLKDLRLQVKRLGLDAGRDAAQKRVLDLKFDPKGSTDLDKPKFGKEDPNNEPHHGGNTWAGGVRASCFRGTHH